MFKRFFILSLFIFSVPLWASLESSCGELKSCIDHVAKLTGKKYLYSNEVKGKIFSTSNTDINKENADELLSYILHLNGYSRVRTSQEDTYIIVPSREIRYTTTMAVVADKNTPPKLEALADYYMMYYHAHDKDYVKNSVRALRPFLSRYGRIIDVKNTSTLVVQDTALNLKRIYTFLKKFDRKPTKKEMAKKKERMRRFHELAKIEARNCQKIKDKLTECKMTKK